MIVKVSSHSVNIVSLMLQHKISVDMQILVKVCISAHVHCCTELGFLSWELQLRMYNFSLSNWHMHLQAMLYRVLWHSA